MTNPTTIVQLADVKAHLNIEVNDYDVELQQFIDASTSVIERITGPVIVQTFTEYFDGGCMAITLNHLPLVSVSSVVETMGDVNYTLAAITLGSGTSNYAYSLDTNIGQIVRRVANAAATFADGVKNVKVTYTAGRSRIPGNVRLATLMLIQHWWSQSQYNRQGGRPNLGGDDVMNMGSGFAIPNRVRELLQPDPDIPGVA